MARNKNDRDGRSHKRSRHHRRLMIEHLANRRVLAAVTGAVFEDLDQSFRQEAGEVGLADRLVYLDINESGALDTGEQLVRTDANGEFTFEDLISGVYQFRMYNGSSSQAQVSPFGASAGHPTAEIANAFALEAGDELAVLTSGTVEVADLTDGSTTSIPVSSFLTAMQELPDGNLLVVGNANFTGDTAWVVDPTAETVTPVELPGDEVMLSQLAIDGEGRGIALAQSSAVTTMVSLYSVDASQADSIEILDTELIVPLNTQLMSSDSGNRSVLAWASSDGLEVSLWSNTTASLIDTTPITVANASELVAFDDASGLLVVRSGDEISVHDANANFAPLATMAGVPGPVAIDGSRDLLIAIANETSSIQVFDVRDGTEIANVAADLSTVGEVSAVEVENDPNAVIVLGDSGVTRITLTQPAAHVVTVVNADVDSVDFAVNVLAENAAPAFNSVPDFETDEDRALSRIAPGFLQDTADPDGDSFIAIQTTETSNGVAVVGFTGSLSYEPDADFNGTDEFSVILHDGRDASDETAISVTINAVADGPFGIDIDIAPIDENADNDHPLGPLEVIDVDGGPFRILIDDPRFVFRGGQIIFIGNPGDLDFEVEPVIPLEITVIDDGSDSQITRETTVTVRDANDPITNILIRDLFIEENDVGPVEIGEITVVDQDSEQQYTFTTDDSRFTVNGDVLTSAAGVSFNYEVDPSITFNLTATEAGETGTSLREK